MPVASHRAHAHTGLGTTLNNECPAECVVCHAYKNDSSLTFVMQGLLVFFTLWYGLETVGVCAGGATWWLSVTQ
jgi:hypothetical protein